MFEKRDDPEFPPFVLGGQSRSPEDVIDSADALRAVSFGLIILGVALWLARILR